MCYFCYSERVKWTVIKAAFEISFHVEKAYLVQVNNSKVAIKKCFQVRNRGHTFNTSGVLNVQILCLPSPFIRHFVRFGQQYFAKLNA